jgi:NAD(P)-dependent dehydrogenase (short-subunit alcohol dehydrogenase family)
MMSDDRYKTAIVTGGLRGLGRAMVLSLAREGFRVVAVGHIDADFAKISSEAAYRGLASRLLVLIADLRKPKDCDRVISETLTAFGSADILINNAGLTFTTIWPDLGRRASPPKSWEASDEIVQAVMDTNYVAADQMTRRLAPRMIERGWGRIINVTTKLDTMNKPGSSAYGPSKAALEMATQIFAKELAGTGVTINVLNPGAGADTEGMAPEFRAASRAGRIPRLVAPEQMVAPLLWLVSHAADGVNGRRFDANAWDSGIAPNIAAARASRPAGFELRIDDAPRDDATRGRAAKERNPCGKISNRAAP